MCMHWLKYVRLNRRPVEKYAWYDTGSRHADVSDAYSVISSVYQYVTGPLRHEPSSLSLDVLAYDWSTKR